MFHFSSNNTRSRRTVRLAAAASAFAIAGCALGVDTATLRPIGSLPGTNASWGYGVSDDGSWVVGRSGTNFYYGNSSHAYSWHSSDNSITDLTPLDPDSTAYGISSDGTTVVGVRRTGGGQTHSFACDTLGTPANSGGGGADELFAVSGNGTSYVGYEMSGGNPGTPRALRWSADTRWQTIDNSSMTYSKAYATSSDGSVIAGQATFAGVGARAFVWTATTGPVNIGSASPTGVSSEARGVSADGSIVVGTAGGRGFAWTSAGGMQMLATLPGVVSNIVYGLSGNGATILGSSVVAGDTRSHAVIWRSGVMLDLQTVLAGVTPAGWHLFEARAATPDGLTIVGTAWNNFNEPEAFIATVPLCIESSIAQQPASLTAVPGQPASMSVGAGGMGPFTYQWRKDGVEIPGAIGPMLTINAVTAADAGSYTCVVTGSCGSQTPTLSSAAILTVRCTADINNSGSLTVQDIFDFLAAYFGSAPEGDFNASGANTVQDIFDFLAAYFAGCN